MVPLLRYVEEYGRAGQATDDNVIRRMCFECLITKTTHTHALPLSLSICNNYTATLVRRTRLNVMFTCILPILFSVIFFYHWHYLEALEERESTISYKQCSSKQQPSAKKFTKCLRNEWTRPSKATFITAQFTANSILCLTALNIC